MTGPPELEEKPVPRGLKLTAIAYVVVVGVCLWVFRDRIPADAWPPDASRVAPNILASVIIVMACTPIAVLVWPPTRRRIHRWMTSHTAPLHEQLERLHEQRERHHAEQMAKLDAIHWHVSKSRDAPP